MLSAFTVALQKTQSLRQDQLTGRAVSQTTCTGTHPQHCPTQQCQHSLVLTPQQDVWFGSFFYFGGSNFKQRTGKKNLALTAVKDFLVRLWPKLTIL